MITCLESEGDQQLMHRKQMNRKIKHYTLQHRYVFKLRVIVLTFSFLEFKFSIKYVNNTKFCRFCLLIKDVGRIYLYILH